MESKKERYERLKKLLVKSEEDLVLARLELKKEKLRGKDAEKSLNSTKLRFNKIFGIDIDEVENNLIESANKIINTTPPH